MRNICFICIDCLRNDFVEKEYADTPFLNQLLERGKHYSEMYSTTTTTTPAVASFMTGLYSERNGVNSLREVSLNSNAKTLAEKFSDKGYNTRADVTGPIVEKTEINRGFDEYNYRGHSESLFGEWEKELAQSIDGLESPFFHYIHLWEIHGPVNVPNEFDKEKYGVNDYGRALAALDRKLEKLKNSLPEDTVLIIHGDHGESVSFRESSIRKWLKRGRTLFNYHLGLDTSKIENRINKIANKISSPDYPDHFLENGHGENIYDFTTNVPLIIDGLENTENIDKQVRQIDIYPTILEIADIKPSKNLDGRTLLKDRVEDRKAYIRACGSSLKKKRNWKRGLRHAEKKLVTHPNRKIDTELYDLDDDPLELNPVADKEQIEKIESNLLSKKLLGSKELEIKGKLKELGYM